MALEIKVLLTDIGMIKAWGLTMAARTVNLDKEYFSYLMMVGFFAACLSHR